MSRFKNENGFNIQFYSGCDFENLTAEIYFDGKYVASVIQEKGPGEFEILFPDSQMNQDVVISRFDMNGFVETLLKAKEELMERLPSGD
ncbi:MAG: hypothetical protein ACPGSB_02645 [Opitutales bacterium]